jgi:hypothetical protein
MANITEIRDSVVTRGRSLLGEATKPVYAWIGAGDVVRSQVVTLPARLKGIRETLPDSPAAVRNTVEGYAASALTGFAELTQRGERVVDTVRHRSADVVEPAVLIDAVEPDDDADILEASIARPAKKTTSSRAPKTTTRAPKATTRTTAVPANRRTSAKKTTRHTGTTK